MTESTKKGRNPFTGSDPFSDISDENLKPHHIHVRYSGQGAVFTFDGEVSAGEPPHKQRRLMQAWIELQVGELEADWELAVNLGASVRY